MKRKDHGPAIGVRQESVAATSADFGEAGTEQHGEYAPGG